MSAREDDEVIGIVDDLGTQPVTLPAQPPVLQKAVHVEQGEQWREGAPLGNTAPALLAPAHTPLTIPAGFLDRRPEPEFDQAQHVPVDDPPQYRLQQVTVGDRVEGLGQISVDNIRVTATEKLVDHLGRIAHRAFRSVTT